MPPNKVIFWGNNSEGKKIIDMIIIPEKKEKENKKLLIIFSRVYINSISFCLLDITFAFDFFINTSAGLGLKL